MGYNYTLLYTIYRAIMEQDTRSVIHIWHRAGSTTWIAHIGTEPKIDQKEKKKKIEEWIPDYDTEHR